ncbi:glucokinase regulatory protein-like isoform X1 [Sycon ciliatum]|uniref:glucokinase regulatory protein-like isoform X1 n=1 Tax=Sycon ciliatum TaxID=27933 RepID=UPI0031F6BFA0
MSSQKRITERSNELTKNIDSGSAEDIVYALSLSDAQIFDGFEAYESILSARIVTSIEELCSTSTRLILDTLSGRADNVIVFSGSGTSGRMGWLCARTFNQILKDAGHPACFKYSISGGDEALIVSKEMPEDSPVLGVQDLKERIGNKDRALIVGITCGLSAPYVAGQLDWALGQEHVTPCLMGFNPVEIARNDSVENWSKTCRQVFTDVYKAAASADKDGEFGAFVLNPVVGPEPVTGSTRMKGGSATKILLEIVFMRAIHQALESYISGQEQPVVTAIGPSSDAASDDGSSLEPVAKRSKNCESSASSATATISMYRQACDCVYRSCAEIGEVLQSGATSISTGGHLYYLGSGSFALLGLIDASEMVDTFGTSADEVRGFVEDGWAICANEQGDLSSTGRAFRMSIDHFNEDIAARLSERDTVVLLSNASTLTKPMQHIWSIVMKSQARLAHVTVSASSSASPTVTDQCDRECLRVPIALQFPDSSKFRHVLEQFAMKLVLNAISTGANIKRGRVLGNTMINVSVSNNKLYYRAASIVKEMTSASDEEAFATLHRSIYRSQPDALAVVQSKLISEHILAARHLPMVVPLAILLTTEKYRGPDTQNVADALECLSTAGSLRQSLTAFSRQ